MWKPKNKKRGGKTKKPTQYDYSPNGNGMGSGTMHAGRYGIDMRPCLRQRINI